MEYSAVIDALNLHFGSKVSTNSEDCEKHALSREITDQPSLIPKAVIYPSTTNQVSEIIKLCKRFNAAIYPFNHEKNRIDNPDTKPLICIDLSRMRNIVDVDKKNKTITAEFGVGFKMLVNTAKDYGLEVNMDYDSDVLIGNIAINEFTKLTAYNIMSITYVDQDGNINTQQTPYNNDLEHSVIVEISIQASSEK